MVSELIIGNLQHLSHQQSFKLFSVALVRPLDLLQSQSVLSTITASGCQHFFRSTVDILYLYWLRKFNQCWYSVWFQLSSPVFI